MKTHLMSPSVVRDYPEEARAGLLSKIANIKRADSVSGKTAITTIMKQISKEIETEKHKKGRAKNNIKVAAQTKQAIDASTIVAKKITELGRRPTLDEQEKILKDSIQEARNNAISDSPVNSTSEPKTKAEAEKAKLKSSKKIKDLRSRIMRENDPDRKKALKVEYREEADRYKGYKNLEETLGN